jgi:aminomethyltransferase
VREASDIYDGADVVVGHVTSGSFSPSLGRPIAMALLDRSVADFGHILFAKVRNHRIAVTVTRLPFIPHRYHR